MYQRNRNLFSFLAVLLAAGLITGIGGLFLYLSDMLGGAPRLASEETDLNAPTLAFPGAAPSLAVEAADDGAAVVSESAADKPADNELIAAVATVSATTIGTHSAAVLSVATAPDNRIIASGSYDNTVKVWNRNEPAQTAVFPHDASINELIFTADGQALITGTDAGNIQLWNLASAQLMATLSGGPGRINSVAADNTHQTIASGSSSGVLKLWQIPNVAADGKESATDTPVESVVLSEAGPQINALVFHPTDSNLLVSANQKGVLQVWDIAQNSVVQTLADGANQIVSIDISRDGQYVATGSYDQTVRVWDIESGELVRSLKGHSAVVSEVAFSPNSLLLASGSYDESIKIWDWSTTQITCTLQGKAGFVYDLAFADEGETLVSGSYDGTLEAWDLAAAPGCLDL